MDLLNLRVPTQIIENAIENLRCPRVLVIGGEPEAEKHTLVPMVRFRAQDEFFNAVTPVPP